MTFCDDDYEQKNENTYESYNVDLVPRRYPTIVTSYWLDVVIYDSRRDTYSKTDRWANIISRLRLFKIPLIQYHPACGIQLLDEQSKIGK